MDVVEITLIKWINTYLIKNNLYFVPFDYDQNNNRYKFLGTNMIIQKNKDFEFVYNYYKVFNDKQKLVNCDYKILKSILSRSDKNFIQYEDKYLKLAKDKTQQVFQCRKFDFNFLPFFDSLIEYKDYILYNDTIHTIYDEGNGCDENGVFAPMLQKYNYDSNLIFIAIKKEKIYELFTENILDENTFFIRKFKELHLTKDEDLEDVHKKINFLNEEDTRDFFKHIIKYKNIVKTDTKDKIPIWLNQCIILNNITDDEEFDYEFPSSDEDDEDLFSDADDGI